ncbi:conserved hypothetical secreted protein [Mycobacterium tuberculosis C]|nr:conserved hypothetical secreted protein [Mycobacterium tuberculosis C]
MTSAQGDHQCSLAVSPPPWLAPLELPPLGPGRTRLRRNRSASSTDEAFLAQLQADGITPPSAARAIKDAHAVCDALDEGHSAKAVIKAVAKATGLSAKGAKTFAVDAASAYCPQYVTSS